MAKTSRERQSEYRARHLKGEKSTMSRLTLMVNDTALMALRRLAKHYEITQAALLERVLLEEQSQVLERMTKEERQAYNDAVTW